VEGSEARDCRLAAVRTIHVPLPATAATMSVVSAPAINPSQMAVTGPVTIQST